VRVRVERYLTGKNRQEMILRWRSAVEKHAAPRPHWKLDPAAAVLLVVDVQRAFCDPAGAHFLPAFEACAGPLEALIAAWRAAGRPVVFTRHGHADPPGDGVHGRFWGSVLDREGADAALVWPATPAPGEPVIVKDTYDAFHQTELEEILRDARVRQVLVAGVLTHLCVETTVRAAFVRDFEPFVVMDACASNLARLHEDALVAMAAGFAGVLTTDEAVAACR
jgi:nicotinamidase-related amidase